MRHKAFGVVGVVLYAALGVPGIAAPQNLAPPTIHRVTVQLDTGVLTVSGMNLGPNLLVSVDGQPVPQLPGATETQMEVLAPTTVLTTPGSYRLTVVDPARQLGDVFVVASPAMVALGTAAPNAASASATGLVGRAAAGPALPTARPSGSGPAPLLIEEASGNYLTALGYLALTSNTAGSYNTAIGAFALRRNTTGYHNTASGTDALADNTSGRSNTASGKSRLPVTRRVTAIRPVACRLLLPTPRAAETRR